MKKSLAVISILIFVVVFACSKKNNLTSSCSNAATSFSTDVSPVIQASCATNAGCHGSGSNNGPGALTTYSEIFNARSQIRAAVASGTMPQTGSLTADQKNSIICWIDAGAQNN